MRVLRAAWALCLLASCRASPADVPDGAVRDVRGVDAPADSAEPDATPVVDAMLPDGVSITPGAPNHVLLLGTVVTPQTIVEGAVLVEDDRITCVDTEAACRALPNATGATEIHTNGVIAPGLVDTHNHILFDIFDGDDWLPAHVYGDHDQWTSEPRYIAMLDVKQCLADDSQGKPAWCANTPYGSAAGSLRCEMDKYGELKGLIAGTTSIVGLPGTSAGCFGSIARSIDVPQNELPSGEGDKIQTSALFPPSSPSNVCANFADGSTNAYLVHVGEGTDAKAAGEFAKLGTLTTPAGCLYAPQTAITHGVAFGSAELAQMGSAGMKLIWSPQSNVSLYGATADIPTALANGVTVAIAPDWSMGGSVDMLDELRFANAWDDAHFADQLAPQDLVEMGTVNAAKALALDGQIGELSVGALADIAVFAGDRAHPYDAILAAHPQDVRLVMVGGVTLYGDAGLVAAGPAQPGCEGLDVCGASKFACVATTSTVNKLDETFVQISLALGSALSDADAQTPGDGFDFAPLAPLARCQ